MNTVQQKITVTMSPTEHRRYLAFLEADKIVKGIKKSLKELNQARKGEIKLKSAYDLINEL
jgi:hypothetical protein